MFDGLMILECVAVSCISAKTMKKIQIQIQLVWRFLVHGHTASWFISGVSTRSDRRVVVGKGRFLSHSLLPIGKQAKSSS